MSSNTLKETCFIGVPDVIASVGQDRLYCGYSRRRDSPKRCLLSNLDIASITQRSTFPRYLPITSIPGVSGGEADPLLPKSPLYNNIYLRLDIDYPKIGLNGSRFMRKSEGACKARQERLSQHVLKVYNAIDSP